MVGVGEFQSTCPARGTTHPFKSSAHVSRISIHVPREGHDGRCVCSREHRRHFNPRAPRGARPYNPIENYDRKEFQSTCPARGTTLDSKKCPSISKHFNPRAPRGARPCRHILPHTFGSISIHVPREGHDVSDLISDLRKIISIHVPREGHDRRR